MSYSKIKLEDWKKLSQEERDYHTLEFNKSVEVRKKWTVISTRVIALGLIVVLFFIGYVQLENVRNYNQKIDKLGTLGFCALCGEYTMKKCECQYATLYNAGSNKPNEINKTKIALELSDYNGQQCQPYSVYIENKTRELINWSLINST